MVNNENNGARLLQSMKNIGQIVQWLLVPILYLLWAQNVSIGDMRMEVAMLKERVSAIQYSMGSQEKQGRDVRDNDRRIIALETRLGTIADVLRDLTVELRRHREEMSPSDKEAK